MTDEELVKRLRARVDAEHVGARMMTEEEYKFGAYISDILSSHPEWLGTAIHATQAGIASAIKQSEADRLEWETIAMVASDARLFKSRSIWIGDKLERLKGRASCRWDHIIARLRAAAPPAQR